MRMILIVIMLLVVTHLRRRLLLALVLAGAASTLAAAPATAATKGCGSMKVRTATVSTSFSAPSLGSARFQRSMCREARRVVRAQFNYGSTSPWACRTTYRTAPGNVVRYRLKCSYRDARIYGRWSEVAGD
jgi:hypothetical protein